MLWMQTFVRDQMRRAQSGEPASIARAFTLFFQPIPEGKQQETQITYEYRFLPARSTYDPVLQVLRVMVEDLKGKHIEVASRPYTIVPTDDAPVIWPPSEEVSYMATKFYTIDDFGRFPLTVPITVLPRWPNFAAPTPETIHVWYDGKWILFKDWILSLEPYYEDCGRTTSYLTGKRGLAAQDRMWQANSQHFRFLDLPTELRIHVYELALGNELYPLSTVSRYRLDDTLARRNAHLTLGRGRYVESHLMAHFYSSPKTRLSIEEPNLALLRVNKQVHCEISHLAWAVMRKLFVCPDVFTTAVDARLGPAMRFEHLASIELSFTNAEYFAFFGIEVHPRLQINPQTSLGHYLRDTSGIKNLQLRFRSLQEGYRTSPWGENRLKHSLPRFRRFVYECCQRTMVDWICTTAYPFLQAIKTVTVTGEASQELKGKWNAIFNGSRTFDQPAEMLAVLATPDTQLPSPCACMEICGVSNGGYD